LILPFRNPALVRYSRMRAPFFSSSPISLVAAMDIASKIPVVEGGPAKRGEPHELVPGVGELEATA
jgi:hypothetical protein